MRRWSEKQFDGYVAIDSLHVNGKLTLGENIADLGRPVDLSRGLPAVPGGEAGAGADRRIDRRSALLPGMGPDLASKGASGVHPTDGQHGSARASQVPDQRPPIQHPCVCAGIRLQAGRSDGSSGDRRAPRSGRPSAAVSTGLGREPPELRAPPIGRRSSGSTPRAAGTPASPLDPRSAGGACRASRSALGLRGSSRVRSLHEAPPGSARRTRLRRGLFPGPLAWARSRSSCRGVSAARPWPASVDRARSLTRTSSGLPARTEPRLPRAACLDRLGQPLMTHGSPRGSTAGSSAVASQRTPRPAGRRPARALARWAGCRPCSPTGAGRSGGR